MKYVGQWKLEIEGKEELKQILYCLRLAGIYLDTWSNLGSYRKYIKEADELYGLLFKEEEV